MHLLQFYKRHFLIAVSWLFVWTHSGAIQADHFLAPKTQFIQNISTETSIINESEIKERHVFPDIEGLRAFIEAQYDQKTKFHWAYKEGQYHVTVMKSLMADDFDWGAHELTNPTQYFKSHFQALVDPIKNYGRTFDGKTLVHIGSGPTLKEVLMLHDLMQEIDKIIIVELTLDNLLNIVDSLKDLPEELKSKIEFYRSDIETLEFNDGVIDFVFANEVLVAEMEEGGFIQLKTAWQTIGRILKEGGFFLGYSEQPSQLIDTGFFRSLKGNVFDTTPRILQKSRLVSLAKQSSSRFIQNLFKFGFRNSFGAETGFFEKTPAQWIAELSQIDQMLLLGYLLNLEPNKAGQLIIQGRFEFQKLLKIENDGQLIFSLKDTRNNEICLLRLFPGNEERNSKDMNLLRNHPDRIGSGVVRGKDDLWRTYFLKLEKKEDPWEQIIGTMGSRVRALDIGGYDGSFAKYLETILTGLGIQSDVTAIDLYPRDPSVMKLNLNDALNYFGPQSFDVVFINRPSMPAMDVPLGRADIILHASDSVLEDYFNQAKALVKPGGYIILTIAIEDLSSGLSKDGLLDRAIEILIQSTTDGKKYSLISKFDPPSSYAPGHILPKLSPVIVVRRDADDKVKASFVSIDVAA